MTTILLTLATLAAALLDGSLFELQRGGDAWRMVTCHFTHFTNEQLAWDALAFVVLGIACERRSRAAFHATLLASAIVIPLAVLAFDPRIGTYRGLSGIDSALFALLVVSTRNRLLGRAFVAKIAFEMITGGAVFVGDITVVPVAHVAGAVAGAVVALIAKAAVPADQPPTPGSRGKWCWPRASLGQHSSGVTNPHTLRRPSTALPPRNSTPSRSASCHRVATFSRDRTEIGRVP